MSPSDYDRLVEASSASYIAAYMDLVKWGYSEVPAINRATQTALEFLYALKSYDILSREKPFDDLSKEEFVSLIADRDF